MRWVAAAVLVISESQELKQGVADLLLPVFSPLDVDKLFSFLFIRGRWAAERRGCIQVGSTVGNCMPGRKLLKPALVCARTAP